MTGTIEQNISTGSKLGFASLDQLIEFAEDCADDKDRDEFLNSDLAFARILYCKLGQAGFASIVDQEEIDVKLINLDLVDSRLTEGGWLRRDLGENVTEFAEDFIYDRRQFLGDSLDNRGEL